VLKTPFERLGTLMEQTSASNGEGSRIKLMNDESGYITCPEFIGLAARGQMDHVLRSVIPMRVCLK